MVRSDEQKGDEVPPDDLPGLHDDLDDADLPGLDDHPGSPTPDEPVTPEASGPDWEAIDTSLDEWKAHLDTEGARREAEKEDFAWRRLMLIAVTSGLISLVLVMGFLFTSGDTDDTAVADPSETAVEDTAPPSTTASAEDTEPSAVAVDVPDISAVPFPSSWTYTATKTASISLPLSSSPPPRSARSWPGRST